MSDTGGKLIALGGLAAAIAYLMPKGGQVDVNGGTLGWWPNTRGQGGDVPAGDADIGPITAETPEGQDVLEQALPDDYDPRPGQAVPRDPNLPRGIRNANPGNIELGDPWQGLAENQTDGRFAQFTSPVYGIRAMSRVLDTYAGRGVDTVRSIIATWAPSHENNVSAYVGSVAEAMGVDPDQRLTADDRPALIAAMIRHENGMQPYSYDTIREGIRLA